MFSLLGREQTACSEKLFTLMVDIISILKLSPCFLEDNESEEAYIVQLISY